MTSEDTRLSTPPPSPLPPPLLTHPALAAPNVATRQRSERPDPLRRLLHHDGTAVALLGLDGAIHDLSTAMLELLGADTLAEVTVGSPADGVLRSFLDHVPSEVFRDGSYVWHGRMDHQDLEGRHLLLRATVSALHDPSRSGGGDLALLLHDITRPNDQMRALVHRATHDPLTGLANRHQLLRQLSQAIGQQRDRPGHVAAIFLDLDHLKQVNDAFGHEAGDQLLVSSARRLEQALRPADEIARIGGDEFLALATGVTDSESAVELADRARRALSGHLSVGALDVEFSVSVGIALSDAELLTLNDDDAAAMLISNADTAMYQSKENGRGRCTLFTSHMRSTARTRAELANALSQALQDGVLRLDYQPIHSAVSGATVAAEALVRWHHPGVGHIDAATIVAVAEESGSIGRLGEFVLGQALQDLRGWRQDGLVDSTFAVHVNVSRLQLGSDSFVKLVADLLNRHGLQPAQLVLEARESPLLSRESEVIRSIRALRRFGVQIAIDNFGTGAKALSVLTDVGADILKLDGSLALPFDAGEADIRLVRAVILLAHALDMDVVAERVSGPDQLRRLQAAGCDMLQGNLIGRPTPLGEIDFAISTVIPVS
ncbi:MAG: putative bifunctional diguanylate cyclase/phosphodiesterase [Ilumatobacter sp.]